MNTGEFKERLVDLGYGYDQELHTGGLRIRKGIDIVAFTKVNKFGVVDTGWEATVSLSNSELRELLDLLVKYATTPIAERGEAQ